MAVSSTSSNDPLAAYTSALPGVRTYDPSGTGSTSSTTATGSSTQGMTQQFLKLLTTQLQNQDPLNPTDSTQMTSQLAQLNMVDGINTMSQQITSMVSQMQQANQLNQAATVGRSVMISGNSWNFDGSTPVSGGVILSKDVTDLQVTIKDALGNTVEDVNIGAAKAGMANFTWDGSRTDGTKAAAGTYSFTVKGTQADGTTVTPAGNTALQVSSVAQINGTTNFGLSDGSSVTMDKIVEWLK